MRRLLIRLRVWWHYGHLSRLGRADITARLLRLAEKGMLLNIARMSGARPRWGRG